MLSCGPRRARSSHEPHTIWYSKSMPLGTICGARPYITDSDLRVLDKVARKVSDPDSFLLLVYIWTFSKTLQWNAGDTAHGRGTSFMSVIQISGLLFIKSLIHYPARTRGCDITSRRVDESTSLGTASLEAGTLPNCSLSRDGRGHVCSMELSS